MKKQILILHGFNNSSSSYFLPNLKERYKDSFIVVAPDFPNPLSPNVDKWTEVIESLDARSFHAVIGFSLGGAFALSLISRDIISCDSLVLIASSSGPKDDPGMNTFVRYPIDFPKVRNMAKNILTIQSLDDPWTFPEYGLLTVKHSNGYGLIYADKGHFEMDALPKEALLMIDSLVCE